MDLLRWAGVFAAICLYSVQAFSCGACTEDKVAATYDYAVIQSALAQNRVMVFCEVKGTVAPERLRQVASEVAGIDAASIRISTEPAAVSFAMDSKVQSPEAAAAQITNQLGRAAKVLVLPGAGTAR